MKEALRKLTSKRMLASLGFLPIIASFFVFFVAASVLNLMEGALSKEDINTCILFSFGVGVPVGYIFTLMVLSPLLYLTFKSEMGKIHIKVLFSVSFTVFLFFFYFITSGSPGVKDSFEMIFTGVLAGTSSGYVFNLMSGLHNSKKYVNPSP
jgi:hypothetical protein